MDPEQVRAHNEAVDRLWADYGRGENERVPVTFASDEFLWLGLSGRTFREFYTDPRVQLETAATTRTTTNDVRVNIMATIPSTAFRQGPSRSRCSSRPRCPAPPTDWRDRARTSSSASPPRW